MRVAMILAAGALAALIGALLTGSLWPALLVIALAGAGIVLLLRDWRSTRVAGGTETSAAGVGGAAQMRADEFSPDISTDPGGPSSDARSDQV